MMTTRATLEESIMLDIACKQTGAYANGQVNKPRLQFHHLECTRASLGVPSLSGIYNDTMVLEPLTGANIFNTKKRIHNECVRQRQF